MADEWPGEYRRRPPMSSPTYAVRAPLAAWLREEAAARPAPYRVLDVGCGVKPYYPFFEPYASEYVGVDVVENPAADLQGAAESLPVEDASFDVVLCIQVLEHADDPAQAVRELRRVVKPGGTVLASTHGVQVYHPAPVDLWRWTHAGLDRLFRENGDWSSLSVRPASGSTACVAMLVSIYADLLARRLHVPPLGRAVVSALNRGAAALDRRSTDLSEPRSGSLIANYHVVAEP
jgi:SAM-dependent methyltransferase